MSPASLTYVYGLTRAGAPLPEEPGVHGGPLRLLDLGRVGAVVSDVPAAEFDEDALREHLEDLGWLEEVARRHDAIVQACHRAGVAMPLRLATIYVDDESAAQRLTDIADEAERTLDRLDGCDEWGVKLFDTSASGGAPSTADPAPASGADYLRRRQAEMMRSGEAAASAAAEADAVYQALAKHAVDDVRHRPQDPRLSGRREPMSLNAAFLVRRGGDTHTFRAAAAELAGQHEGDAIVLTGPWAPYSFAGTAT